MQLIELQKRALEIRAKYAQLEKQEGHHEWDRRDLVQGFVGDVETVTMVRPLDG